LRRGWDTPGPAQDSVGRIDDDPAFVSTMDEPQIEILAPPDRMAIRRSSWNEAMAERIDPATKLNG
jgi:hypothetical protein